MRLLCSVGLCIQYRAIVYGNTLPLLFWILGSMVLFGWVRGSFGPSAAAFPVLSTCTHTCIRKPAHIVRTYNTCALRCQLITYATCTGVQHTGARTCLADQALKYGVEEHFAMCVSVPLPLLILLQALSTHITTYTRARTHPQT